MISNKLEKAINNQINAEYYSAYLYLSMSAYLDHSGLKGFANWTKVQHQEELSHMLKFYNYLIERGGKVVLVSIDAPENKWDSALDVAKAILKHEQFVTSKINSLVDLAIAEKDHATNNFLQWYVSEQVEEEANVGEIVDKLRMLDGSKQGLFIMDKDLGTRVFVDTTQQ